MEQVNVMVFGQIVAHQAELEAMKIQNDLDKMNGNISVTFERQDFMDKAEEIRSTINQLFR